MKKIFSVIITLLILQWSSAQWTKVNSVASNDIVSLAIHNNTLYAASDSNIIYKSQDGLNWDGRNICDTPVRIATMSFYKNDIYIGTSNAAVFSSSDDGLTWNSKKVSTVSTSQFVVNNDLFFSATLGDGVYALDTNAHSWFPFNNSLPFYSFNVQAIISSSSFLIAGAGSNGTFYRYNFINNSWNEEYYFGTIRTGLQFNRLMNVGDTIWAVNGQNIVRSNNGGISWIRDNKGTHEGGNRNIYAGSESIYTLTNLFGGGTWIQQRSRQAAVNDTWINKEEFWPGGNAYDIIEFNHQIFLANYDGLFVRPPEIILPVHFISFKAKCNDDKVLLSWETTHEVNDVHFGVERSVDGIHWLVIAGLPVRDNGGAAALFSYTDHNPLQNGYYRILSKELDGGLQYSKMISTSCSLPDMVTLSPNPVHNNAAVNIYARNNSQAVIKVFDNKGAMVRTQRETVVPGSNLYHISMGSFAGGTYTLTISWNNMQSQKTMQMVKQ